MIGQVEGFKVAGVHCGLKKNNALDFALFVSDAPCTAAGIFTTNTVKAAPVLVNMARLKRNPEGIRVIAVNTGSANACTGQQGIDNTNETARYVAQKLGIHEEEVLVLSTGVIGKQLPMDKIKQGVDLAIEALNSTDWENAARAIMTTDTKPKQAYVQTETFRIAGVSKGSGMIAPNMATMLGVIVTDAVISVEEAQLALKAAADVTYNRIVVDGDMSTNDTVLLLANGVSGAKATQWDFVEPLRLVCEPLAKAIVQDGEGVTKFITLHVTGAQDEATANTIAHTIATSALVKTAFFGNDANWGRIIAATGRAGVPFMPDAAKLYFSEGESEGGGLLLFSDGMPTDYSEEDASAIIKHSHVTIHLDCGVGQAKATIWTCDLSHDYVSINAEYRT